jgi:DNA transformation protein
MASSNPEFAQYCCELMATVGPCRAKRMFGGWGISTDGLTIAIVADLGQGDILWIKADDVSRAQFEAAGCERFIYEAKGKPMGMNYYSAPADAMESPALMAPWASLAFQSALVAANAKAAKKPRAPRKSRAATLTLAKPPRNR